MMRLISRETLDAEWPWILATVRKALKGSPERLYRQLDCGSSVAMHVSGVADGVLILHAAPSWQGAGDVGGLCGGQNHRPGEAPAGDNTGHVPAAETRGKDQRMH
jgi:hypothetical protein